MGLTDRRKTAKNLVDSCKIENILTVKIIRKKLFPRFVNFKESAKLIYGCVIYFLATLKGLSG